MTDIRDMSANVENDDLLLRPQFLHEYIGQEQIKDNLKIFIAAAKNRNEVLDHILFYGPPGLGKTTLSNIIANEMNTSIKITNGPSLEKPGDLAAILSLLQPGDILFIDEIHRMPKIVEEVLYSAMEDFKIDIIIGKDTSVKTLNLDLAPFTLIGATTRPGDLSSPLRDRFGIDARLEYYTIEEIALIIRRSAAVFNTTIDEDASILLAKCSRSTPRIANRLFKRIRDFAEVLNEGVVDLNVTQEALSRLKVDQEGLDKIDHKIISGIIYNFNGGPVGLDALASTIGEDSTNIEEVYEPYLLQKGYILRTPRGRVATQKAYQHLNLEIPASINEKI